MANSASAKTTRPGTLADAEVTDFQLAGPLAWPSDVGEPLSIDLAPALLADLSRVSAVRAESERKLATELAASSELAEADFSESRRALTERWESETHAANAAYTTAERQILADFDSQFGPTQREYSEYQERAASELQQKTRRAKRKLKEARWEAETIFEASKDEPGKRLDQCRKGVQSILDSLGAIAADAAALLERWRQVPLPPLPAESRPIDASDTLPAQLEKAHGELTELQQLRLPALFQGGRLGWIYMGLWVLIAGLAAPLAGVHSLWIGAVGSTILGTGLAVWLFRRAHSQVEGIYPRLAGTLENSQMIAERLVREAEALCKQQEAEIAERLHRDVRAADERYDTRIAEINALHKTEIERANQFYPQRLLEITSRRNSGLAAANTERRERTDRAQQQYETESAAAQDGYRARLAAIKSAHVVARHELTESWRLSMVRLEALVERIRKRAVELFPAWSTLAGFATLPDHETPPALRFGEFQVEMSQIPDGISAEPSLAAMTPEGFSLPALMPFPNRTSLLIKTRGTGRTRAVDTLQAAMLRLLSTLPPGKARFTIVDPIGLGENFAAFMHLADFDEALVTNRIWTEPRHIEQRLADLSEHMENVIQKYLRNEFQSIEEYNAFAGEIAEPFRFLVIANFPANFSDEALRRLQSIVGSGARCGVSTLISVDMQAPMPAGFDLRELEQAGTVIVQKDRAVWKHERFEKFPLTLEAPPRADDFTRILQAIGRSAKDAGRVEVPFEFIAPTFDQCWTSDSRRGIDVPLGRAGATRLQHLKLGHGTSQHVLVAGQTGSGKSTLLHALITNLALRYSPDEMELYLVDFKKGVEFKTYASHQLPHARVVAIESDREFGLSVLERLDAELKTRADRFRDLGVQDIAGFRQAMPKETLPRILLVIDEFQELFVEDDKISQNGALLLDRLIRQGRAFGVHLLLGSQTLGGAYSLARSTMGQIGVRIALRCSEVDAHLILSEENSAARLLSRAGEAIYNDANGMIEGNHPFQVVWLGEEPREKYLNCIQELARNRANGKPWEQVVFEGNVPAVLGKNVSLEAHLRGNAAATPTAMQIWLGDSVSIKDPTAAVFRPQSGSNLLIVGQNDEGALGITAAAVVSLLAQMPSGAAPAPAADGAEEDVSRCFLLDGAPAGSGESASLAALAGLSPRVRLVGWRDLAPLMGQLAKLVDERAQPGHEHHPPVFVIVYGLQRFRDLRKQEDDFGFSRDDRPPSPAKQFATVLREGPGLGVHVIVWCDSLNNLNRAFDRQNLREFEMRVVFQISSGDSSTLIDTPVAGKLGPYRALYYSEEEGCLEKFRPYGFPTADWLAWAKERLEIV